MSNPRVIVPYVGEPLEIQRDVLASMFIEPEYIDVSGSDWNYWELLKDLWSAGEKFMIIEQDILPWPGSVHLAWKCEEPWCVYPYLIGGKYSPVGHGCVKYDAEVMEKAPDAIVTVSRRHWSTLDSHTIHAIRKAGFRPHVHQPPVIHLNATHTGTRPSPFYVRREGELVEVDPIEWMFGWVPEAANTDHLLLSDAAAARAAENTVTVYSHD